MIAVVGMAIRAPSAPTAEALWDQVAVGANCVEQFAEDPAGLSPVDERLLAHGTRIAAGGVLGDVADFDAGFFGLSHLDAAILDPQQAFFLSSSAMRSTTRRRRPRATRPQRSSLGAG
jgi:acyl transferase domain-containing protein